MLRLDFCDYSDVDIVVRGRVSAVGIINTNKKQKLTFKNNASFRSCISKINNTFIGNTEDLDIAIPMYNLL